jgi:2-oxoisovalerate dehydrogenase E1 component alpha subunit
MGGPKSTSSSSRKTSSKSPRRGAEIRKVGHTLKPTKNTPKSKSNNLLLPKDLLVKMYHLMVRSRILEERMIQMYRRGDAFFWIGGPGEEAFGVALGLLTKKGHGPDFDYLHLHYRCTPTLLALGMSDEDALRLIMNRSTDPCTGGRNFSNHYCFPRWNVLPVSSPIGIQYTIGIGTAIAQRRRKNDKVTIVTGGDAGSAEGDFASSMIWASRPGSELPMYLTIQNNKWGISTDYDSQHGEKNVSDRGRAFGIRTAVHNGNDPIEAYLAIKSDLEYIRKTRKPAMSEFRVSRLYGHSSASGANRVAGEECCIEMFEKTLAREKILTANECKSIKEKYFEEIKEKAELIRTEPTPTADTLWDHTYANNENADWRKF